MLWPHMWKLFSIIPMVPFVNRLIKAIITLYFDAGRLSVDSDEVILRRTIGHKKDEFFLNRKRIQKSEVISLLESAGFSKSNPYYIVQQGKVFMTCNIYDSDEAFAPIGSKPLPYER